MTKYKQPGNKDTRPYLIKVICKETGTEWTKYA